MNKVRELKEEACYVAFNPSKEEATQETSVASGKHAYKLPDGTSLSLSRERFRAPEILFQPSLIGLEYPGVHETVYNAIQKCDLDLRKDLYQQIVLSGGSTLHRGFGERLLAELRRLVPRECKLKISAPPDRHLSTWQGGSVMASLASFKSMWITKQQYEEEGAGIVHRRTF